jgi:hypothetical protein
VPSLDLRFADNKSLVDAVTGASLVTFTRASSGTFVDSAGVIQTAATDVPRFDHNPTTGESLGLLVEEARTNLLFRSGEITISSPWGFQNTAPTIATNAFVAPDGTTTATQVTFAAADSRITQANIPIVTGVTYTISVYARAVGSSLNKFRFAFFDQSAQGVSADFVASSAQWTRFTYSYTSTATNSLGFLQIRNSSDNLANDVYLWGADLQAGAFPTSYIPTTTAAVTRSADVASIGSSAFSSWYRQDEGSLFCEYNRPASVAGLRSMAALSDGGFNNRTTFRTDSPTLLVVFALDGGVLQTSFSLAVASGANNKAAAAYKLNDCNAAANGLIGVNDTSATVPVVDRLSIGSVLNAEPSCSYIRRIVFWPTRLPNSTLQAVTQ